MPGDLLTSDNIPLSEPIGHRASAKPVPTDYTGLLPAALGCDDPEVLRFVAAARSTNTRRAYQSDVAHFMAWGGTIPADAGVVARYLAHHASVLTPATLARRLVRRAAAGGFDDPTTADLVRTTRGLTSELSRRE
jgi:hypothetical protein